MLYKEYEGILIIKTLMAGTNTGYKSSVLVPQHVQDLMFTAPTPLGHRLCSKMAQASATISLATLPCWNCSWRKSEMSSYQTSGTRYVVMGLRNHRMLFIFTWNLKWSKKSVRDIDCSFEQRTLEVKKTDRFDFTWNYICHNPTISHPESSIGLPCPARVQEVLRTFISQALKGCFWDRLYPIPPCSG